MAKRYGMAVIGTGMIGNIHAEAIKGMEEARLVAACDTVEERVRAFAERHGCKAYTTYEQLFDDDDVEVVTIATPSGLHLEPAVAAAKAGRHAIVEKPIEITLERIDQLLEALHSAFTRAARRAGLRHLELAPPLVDGSGARLAASDAAADTGAYAVGWNPDPGSSRPPAVAFATAPWLEFPAAAALAVPGLLRSLPATGDAAS